MSKGGAYRSVRKNRRKWLVAALQTVGSADKCSAEVGGESGPRNLSTALKASHAEPGGERLGQAQTGINRAKDS